MQKLEEKSTEHVFLPVTKKIGWMFGLKGEDVDRMAQNRLGIGVESTMESAHDHFGNARSAGRVSS